MYRSVKGEMTHRFDNVHLLHSPLENVSVLLEIAVHNVAPV
jgi:hypothetical protein